MKRWVNLDLDSTFPLRNVVARRSGSSERRGDAKIPSNIARARTDVESMNPTKPAVAPQAHPATAQARAVGPHPALLPLLKGATFAGVLASASATKAPAPQVNAQGCKMQTSLPQAVSGVHPDADKRHRHGGGDDLDPSTRQAAQLAPPIVASPIEMAKQSAAAQTNARVSLEDLVPELVKKIAWSGDAKRGTVRMELGAGDLAGSTLTVSAENGRVSVHVSTPPGTDTAAWRDRLASRLESRGLTLDTVEVS